MKNKKSILATDFNKVKKEQELWLEKRQKQSQIYQSLTEYILFLENMLSSIDYDYEKCLLEKELKKLRKLQKEYYVPSVLEMAQYDLTKNEEKKNNSLEKSSFSLVKKIQYKK